MIVGGEGSGRIRVHAAPPHVKGTILEVNGVLYVTAPDNVWAIDAHDGHELWRYFWKTRGGTHIGNRGAAMWNNYLFFETPDNYLVSLDARTGKERWHVEIASFDEQYFSTAAPVIVGDHVLVGTGNDLDMPGFLQSFDPETGKLQWKTYTVPMNPGDPGLDTWPSLDAARHGGGQTWIPGAYDPETKLYIIGTGNPTPGYTGQGRMGDNLFTCSLVAFNVDTGKIAWYYQTSPHDTHDWDSAQTPVLIDGTIDGKPRKLVSTAARNGYFFTRRSRHRASRSSPSKFGTTTNWAQGPAQERRAGAESRRRKPPCRARSCRRSKAASTNWPPPAYSPETGLFYVHERNGFNILYLTETDPRGSMGLAGKAVGQVGAWPSALQRDRLQDRQGGLASRVPRRERRRRIRRPPGDGRQAGLRGRRRRQPGRLRRDQRQAVVALAHRVAVSNAPQTYVVDGRQHVLVAVGDTLYSFVIY